MLVRENRIGDMQIVNILAQSNAFFASTSLLIIGGCLAILGSRDQAMAILNEIPGVAGTPPLVWELKVLLLVVVFVFAFFKLTWSLRQFNYVAILIGAAPPPRSRRHAGWAALRRQRRRGGQPRGRALQQGAAHVLFRLGRAQLVRPALPVHGADGAGGGRGLSPRVPLAHADDPGRGRQPIPGA